jgi:hypothetical protein
MGIIMNVDEPFYDFILFFNELGLEKIKNDDCPSKNE